MTSSNNDLLGCMGFWETSNTTYYLTSPTVLHSNNRVSVTYCRSTYLSEKVKCCLDTDQTNMLWNNKLSGLDLCFLSIHIKKYVWNRFQDNYKYCSRMNIYILYHLKSCSALCCHWASASNKLYHINCWVFECFYSEGILTYTTGKKARSAMPILV